MGKRVLGVADVVSLGGVFGALIGGGLGLLVIRQPMPAGEEQPQYGFALYSAVGLFVLMSAVSGAVAGMAAALLHSFRRNRLRAALLGLALWGVVLVGTLYFTGFFAA
jgi:hypothetical protein